MPEMNGAFPIVPYPDPRAAIGWLERAFGAAPRRCTRPSPTSPWCTPRCRWDRAW